jgi:hypothetical protein
VTGSQRIPQTGGDFSVSRLGQVMVISLQKAGTHLMQGLMGRLGYKMAGVPRPDPTNQPVFDAKQCRQLAELALSESDYAELLELEGTDEYPRRIQQIWAALGWHWQSRLGQHIVARYGQVRLTSANTVLTNPYLDYSRFDQLPPGICWIFHELDVNKTDGTFLHEWASENSPRMIYNYRDPRDTLVSMINFLEGRTPAGYGNFYEFEIFSKVLRSKPTWEEKLDYAIADTSFLGWDQFHKGVWLLNHPNVCKVRYEDLVGANGGGSRERQVDALSRMLKHLDAHEALADVEQIASDIYDRNSWSFFRGQTGSWREVFTRRNEAHFREVYGDILEQYEYE